MKQEYALGFAFSRNKQKVVLIKKTKPAWQAGLWNGVGGKIEAGESPIEAMYREFQEETGVDLALPEMLMSGSYTYNNWNHFATLLFEKATVYVFRVFTNAIYQVRTTTEEEVTIRNVARLYNETIPNLGYLIPLALDENTSLTVIEHKTE